MRIALIIIILISIVIVFASSALANDAQFEGWLNVQIPSQDDISNAYHKSVETVNNQVPSKDQISKIVDDYTDQIVSAYKIHNQAICSDDTLFTVEMVATMNGTALTIDASGGFGIGSVALKSILITNNKNIMRYAHMKICGTPIYDIPEVGNIIKGLDKSLK